MYKNIKDLRKHWIVFYIVIARFANGRLSDVILSNPEFLRPGVVKPYFSVIL